MKKCSASGCDRNSRARGFCEMHYMRVMKYGDPFGGRPKARKDGDGTLLPSGYMNLSVNGKTVRMHRHVVEKTIGHKLPRKAVIHHIDNDRTNNKPSNLVVCPDSAYHQLLHRRERALNACGNPNWLKCSYCKKWDAPENLTIKAGNQYHRLCNNAGIYYEEVA